MKNKRLCDPTWNYFPRTFLLYIVPLVLTSFLLYKNLIGFSRDFWVLFIFAMIVPPLNIRKKRWALKDFQNRDCFFYTLPFLFAGLWTLCVAYTSSVWLALLCFMGYLFLNGFLLTKYEILKLYGHKVEILKGSTFKKFFVHGVGWWGYVGIASLLVHKYGTDTWYSWVLCVTLMVIPIQTYFFFLDKKFGKPEKYKNIKKVAVIGGGFSGIYATKWLTEHQIEVDCFEQKDSIGGVWKFCEEEKERATVFKNTRATSSKHFMHAMDFRAKEGYPDFPHHLQYMEFLENYVDHFDIREKIVLNTEVKNIEKRDDKWFVSLFCKNEENIETYDAVIVCTGPQGIPHLKIADDPLYSNFTGKIIHAQHKGHHLKLQEVIFRKLQMKYDNLLQFYMFLIL